MPGWQRCVHEFYDVCLSGHMRIAKRRLGGCSRFVSESHIVVEPFCLALGLVQAFACRLIAYWSSQPPARHFREACVGPNTELADTFKQNVS